MGVYGWMGQQTDGKPRLGFIGAKSTSDAKELLAGMAISKKKLKIKYLGNMGGSEYKLFPPEKPQRLKKKDLSYMFTQLGFLIKSGVTTFEAIEILGTSANTKIAKVCMMMKPFIIEGNSLADSLDMTGFFPSDIMEKVRAGENSNTIGKAFDDISTRLKEELELMSSIKGGAAYPVFSLLSVIGVSMGMLIFLVPQIADIVSSFGAELPKLTLFLIACSDVVRKQWLKCFLIIGTVLGIHILCLKKIYKYKINCDKLIYQLPLIGKIAKKINILYLCSTMAQLLENGKNTTDSLILAKATIKNSYLYETLNKVQTNMVENGVDLYTAMADFEVFPNELLQMIMIGVRTGDVGSVLMSIYNQYRYETKDDIKAATDMIQPISLMIIGVVVAVFVLGMYSAIYCIFDQV